MVFFRAIEGPEITLHYILFFYSAMLTVHRVSNICRCDSNDLLLSCEFMLLLHFSGGNIFKNIWKVSVLSTCDS